MEERRNETEQPYFPPKNISNKNRKDGPIFYEVRPNYKKKLPLHAHKQRRTMLCPISMLRGPRVKRNQRVP